MPPGRPKRPAPPEDSDSDAPTQAQPRRRNAASSDEEADEDLSSSRSSNNILDLSRKLVRYALSCDYTRTPIRRSDISTKVFGTQSAPFKQVFEGAQHHLRNVFGMEMQELPLREKVTLAQRRAAQRSEASQKQKSSNAWILTSTLPTQYRAIIPGSANPNTEDEASYVGLYTMVITLIYAAQDRLPESRLERYLARMFADKNTPVGQTTVLLKRMEKDGYIVRSRDSSSGEEMVEFLVGPRGRMEVDKDSAAKLMASMYGEDPPVDLARRLERTLGTKVNLPPPTPRAVVTNGVANGDDSGDEEMDDDDDG